MEKNEVVDIGPILAEIEPFVHGVHGSPIKKITYNKNSVLIEWFTDGELVDLGWKRI